MSKDNKKIATLWDNKDADEHGHHEHDNHDDSQAFYAGGSEHSGQQILGPSDSSRMDSNRLVENLLNHARHSSALVQDPDDPSQQGGTTLPITFWRNGFTVGQDGPLREYNSHENLQFLESIKRGEPPAELASQIRGGMIDVKLENKAGLDYKPSERKVEAFTGEGHRLGAPVPETTDQQHTGSSSTSVDSSKQPSSDLKVDDTKPATTVQVRLADNTRLVVKVNTSHTVGDIVSHVRAVRPEYSTTNFVLATTFPAKELSDLDQTISDAKLANASVIQKLKR